MAISRTPMIDDDGSGTTGTIFNNAWKQELYNQIDAFVEGAIVPWTVTGSIAGLTTAGTSYYVIEGNFVFVSTLVVWPATADAAGAYLTLPIAHRAGVHGGLVQGYGPVLHRFWIPDNGNNCLIMNASTGAQRINSELSGQTFTLSGWYL